VGVLPGQEHSPHRGSGHGGTRQAQPGDRRRRCCESGFAKQIDDWNKTAARYRSEPETGEGSEELAKRAKHAEHERDEATAKYRHYEIASAGFQIGIVLASATIITGMIALAWASGVLAIAGIAITALGLYAPHLVHLH
jgi:hypothetical protein